MLFSNYWTWRISLPEGDQVRSTSEEIVAEDIFPGGDFQAEWCPWTSCAQVLCHVVAQAAAVCDRAGAAVWLQSADPGICAPDIKHVVPNCCYVHWQNHVGSV